MLTAVLFFSILS